MSKRLIKRNHCAWWNPTGDYYWNSYYAVVWPIVGLFILLVTSALLNPASWATRPECECKEM